MPRLTAVDYDPFASGPSLTPVDYDPFAQTPNARASESAGAVNKKAEAIWGGSFDDWKKRKEADDAERARMVAESEAGNVGSRRAQEFQRQTAALDEAGLQRGEFDTGATVEMMRANAEKGVGGLIEFAGGAPKALADFYGFGRNLDKTNAVTEAGVGIGEVGRTRAEAAQPLLIERPDSLMSTQGLKYIAQQGSISLPQTGAGLAVSTVNPALGLGLIGASAGGAKFSDARAEGRDFWLATEAAAVAAATEAVPEMLPMAALSGRLLKYMPAGTAEKLAKLPGGRGAMTALAEGGSEVATELGNLAYEIQREGKQYTPDQVATRLVDSFAVGTAMGGVVGGLASATGAGADAYERNRAEVERLAAREALQVVEKPRATTARILGPTATPDAAAGAQIADDAFRAAGVGTVAAADMAEQDALERDLDAATRDQLGSEIEIDRLLAGTIGAGDGSLQNGPGLAGTERTSELDARTESARAEGDRLAADGGANFPDGRIGGRDTGFAGGNLRPERGGNAGDVGAVGRSPMDDGTRTLPDGTIFLPGNPAEIRQRLADAGSKWQGMVREIDGVQGVRFGRNAWPEVQGVVSGNRNERGGITGAQVLNAADMPTAGGRNPQELVDANGRAGGSVGAGGQYVSPIRVGNDDGRLAVQPEVASGESTADVAQPTQAAVAVDGRNLAGNEQRSIDRVPELPQSAIATQGVPLQSEQGATDAGRVLEDAGRVSAEPSAPAPPALRDLTDDERNFWPALTSEIRTSIDNPGGRMIRNADGSVGRTKWADLGPMSGFWRERPAGWNSDDVLTALDRAQTGEKLSVKQRNIVDYAKGWVRQYAADTRGDLAVAESDSRLSEREAIRDDIESTLPSVADTSPQQRASVVSLGHDYTAKLIELKRARAAGALNPDQQEAYIDLLEQDRETGKVAGRPMAGIGNKTAYVDALMQGKLMPVQAFLDADNFKALNDKFGHDVGDDVIRLMADVVRDEFGEGNVFHRGGDEFLTQGMTQEEVDAKMARVQDYLARVKMELPLSDGRTATLTGVGVSYGTGATEKAADDSLKQDKQRRKDAGLRFDRREGDDAGRVGPQSAGAGTEADGADSRDSSRAATEGVGSGDSSRSGVGRREGSSRGVLDAPNGTQEVSGQRSELRRAGQDDESSSEAVGERGNAQAANVPARPAGGRAVHGDAVGNARAAISRTLGPKFLRRLESQPWFHLVESLDQLPPDVRKSITGDDIAGFVLPDGRVYIIADSVGDNATGIVLHEVGVHFGMSGLPDFPAMLREFKRMRARSAEVDRAYRLVPEDTDASLIDEEALAYYVEQNWATKSPLMTRIKDAIARLLNRLGIPTSGITDALMRQALDGMVQAAREAADGATRGVVTVRDGRIVYANAASKYSHTVREGRIRKTVAELTNAADSMKSWRDWYDRHDQTLRDVFGDDAELFQKLLSATSQAASVPANIGLALKAYRQLFSGEPFTGYLPAVIKNLDRVAENVALRGQKISEYGSANEGNADAIAVDRHIAMLFFGTKSPNAKQVASAKQRIRTIAERLGWQPREIQAALWAYNQTLLGTRPEDVKSYDTIIEKNRGRIDELRASIGRGEDRGARETGGTAGRDGSAERDTETGREQASAEVGAKYSRRADGGPESLRVVTAGDVVDGRAVREGAPNQSSISSSLDDYTILKGIREVPMDAFDKEYVEGIAEGRIDKRTQDLADAISASKEITPLIVAYDADGAYIIEGGHRLDALIKIGAKSLPAMVVIDESNPPKQGPADARIAYSRKTPAEARAEAAQKQADLGAQLVVSPGQSFVYVDQFTGDWRGQALKMRERVQDKLLSVRNVQQDIERIRGAIEDAANVYRRENLMHGRVGDQRDKLQASHVKPLIEAMAEAKVSPALLEDYLEARHAKERNEKIAATKGGMPDGASGMTTAQAEDFLQGRAAGHRSGVTLDPAMTRQVSRLGRKVYAITAETRRRLLDSGQITQEAFDALENAYAAYVPLRGKDGTEGGKGRGTGKGIDVRGKPVLRAAGRGEGNRAQNILAEVIADAERSIINAEKLRVGRTLARLVLENPNPDVWAIEPVKTELKISEGTPEEIYEAVKNLDQEEGTIIVKVKGKPYRIVIEDQRMADALKNMAVETVPEVIQYVAGLNRYFSAVLTRYNPSFVGVNMTRDLLFGMTGIWAEHGTAAAAKAAASYFPAMRAAWRDIQGKPPVNAMGRYAREFAEAGGKTYFGKLENVSDMSQRIGEEFKTFRQMAMPKFLGGEMSPVRALAKVARDSKMVQAIEAVNDTVENTLRLSVYAARREAGASIEQAAEYAKNISVNFNRRGSATSWLNALYLFFNAATQGAHRTLTLLKNPKVQGVLGGLAALQATSAMFLMGLDDEDGEPLWDSISSWDKQRNLILAIPIKREKGWGATVIKIPMPYGFNLFPYMGGRSVELARDLQEKPVSRAIADYTTDAVVGVAQAMSPIPFDDGWKAALPHWVRIFTVLSENKDDLGIPIRAGDQYDSFDKPRSASGRDDTPRPFKIAATALNRLGGGDDYTPPYAKFALDWAPEDLAYLFKTFAGGLGSNVVKSGTLTEKLIAGVPVNFKDVPVLSSFVSNVDQRQATSTRYYDHKDDIEREVARQRDLAKETGEVGDNPMGIKIARNKSGAKVKRGEGYELEGKPGSLFDTYKQAEKDISRIRDEMRAAFNDQSISYSERIRKIDELKAEREEVQRELNAAWREQRKKRTQ